MSFNKPTGRNNILNSVEIHEEISYATVILNDDQVHINWYSNVDLKILYHHTRLERNRSVSGCLKVYEIT